MVVGATGQRQRGCAVQKSESETHESIEAESCRSRTNEYGFEVSRGGGGGGQDEYCLSDIHNYEDSNKRRDSVLSC